MTDLDGAYARTVEGGVDLDAVRPCHLYRIFVWDHDAWMQGRKVRRLGYIGESGREPLERLLEHLKGRGAATGPKPFGDVVCGWEVDDTEYGCKRDVVAAEEAAVKAERPLFNYEFNTGNPDRVSIPVQQRQRAARDAVRDADRVERARLVTSAAPARRAAPAPRTPRSSPAPRAAPARRGLVRNDWRYRLGGWAGLSLLLWFAALIWTSLPGLPALGAAALVVAGVLVWSCPWWRDRKGWRRSTCKGWGVALLIVAGLWLLHLAGAAA